MNSLQIQAIRKAYNIRQSRKINVVTMDYVDFYTDLVKVVSKLIALKSLTPLSGQLNGAIKVFVKYLAERHYTVPAVVKTTLGTDEVKKKCVAALTTVQTKYGNVDESHIKPIIDVVNKLVEDHAVEDEAGGALLNSSNSSSYSETGFEEENVNERTDT